MTDTFNCAQDRPTLFDVSTLGTASQGGKATLWTSA